jgi:hypothetical protein
MNARTFLAILCDHLRLNKSAIEKPVEFVLEIGGRDVNLKPQQIRNTPKGTRIEFRRI